jgi:glycine reductase
LLEHKEAGTELALPAFEPVTPPEPLLDLAHAKIALVTEGGLVPQGNPDRLATGWSERWSSYPVADLVAHPEQFQAIHGGYDTTHVNRSPFRLVPADVVMDLVAEGRIGQVHDRYYVTAGMATPVENARRMGQEIAEQLKQDGVDAVILTAT